MKLQILTWNVLDRNPDCSRILEALCAIRPDVALLQELTGKHVSAVRSVFPFVSTCRGTATRNGQNFITIASRASQRGVRTVRPNDGATGIRSILARILGCDECQDALLAEVACGDSWLPVACLHASAFASPSHRESELRAFLAALPRYGPLVLGGDFNSYSTPLFSWLAGGFLGHGLSDFSRNEGQMLHEMLARQGFQGGSHGRTTRFLTAPLDHVFVRSCRIISSQVVGERFGSDHYPVVVDMQVTD